jgi:hypothetical protein
MKPFPTFVGLHELGISKGNVTNAYRLYLCTFATVASVLPIREFECRTRLRPRELCDRIIHGVSRKVLKIEKIAMRNMWQVK